MMEAASSSNIITLKLLIDTQANKVLFAEASKDFVDFLCFLLDLPMKDIMDLLSSTSMEGSMIKNMYTSLDRYNPTYFKKDMNLVRKLLFSDDDATLLKSDPPCSIYLQKYYSCDSFCKKVEKNRKFNCSICAKGTSRVKLYVTSTNTRRSDVKGYVPVSYMILDNLSVSEMSMVSSISLMSKLNVTHINVLKEKLVEVGWKDALELLKFFVQSASTSVLSDVFLGKE